MCIVSQCICAFLCIECRQRRVVTNDINLLPAGNITYSPFLPPPDPPLDTSPRIRLCASERSAHVLLYFTQSLYLLYATVRHDLDVRGSNFSIMYTNSFGHRVPYMTVDGVSVRHVYNYIAS